MKTATQMIATFMALTAFAIACVAGLIAHNPSNVVLFRSLGAMLACYFVGLILGTIGDYIVRQHIEGYRKTNPIPQPISLGKEPILVAELAEDQSVGAPGKPTQITQPAQSAQNDRKAA